MSTEKKIRVGVIFGGKSSEHEVSLASARSVMAAMDHAKFEIVPIGIDRDGAWLVTGDPMAQLTNGLFHTSDQKKQSAQRDVVANVGSGRFFFLRQILPSIDVAFPVLHGSMGEDGTIQGLLELAEIPYVGCGVAASALGIDKFQTKVVLQSHGLPQVPFLRVFRRTWEQSPDTVLDQLENHLSYPMFVKPVSLGSSVGVSKAVDRLTLASGLRDAARFDQKIIVEQGIDAREIEVSVLGNEDPLASVPGEIVPGGDFYDYEAKYLSESSRLLIPAPLTNEQTQRVQELTKAAYLALDCAGLARVDMLLSRDTGEIFLNEVNTMPGFTSISMYPKLWQASGIAYNDLIERLIELAFERYSDKQRNQTKR